MTETAVAPKTTTDLAQGEQVQYVNELTTLNLGPTHPATHGIFQNVLTMDGEKIIAGEQPLGTFTGLLKK